jgi:CMD domain protein
VSSAPAATRDVIDAILGVEAGGGIAALRNQKQHLAEELQAYYQAIFEPEAASAEAFPLPDRALVAVRVASHTRSAAVADWYADLALGAGASQETIARARDVATPWTEATRLGAAIRHADLLTTRPAAAGPSDLQTLKDAGYTPAGILSLSQTIAFVNYQLRLIAGLRAFGAER